MSIQITVPLARLEHHPDNVRKDDPHDEDTIALAANIAAIGLLQGLVVAPVTVGDTKGKLLVVAGGRRLNALRALNEAGTWPDNRQVPCRLLSGTENMAEISLAENEVRAGMTPADYIDAWYEMLKKGATEAEIAARWGYTPHTVRQYVKMAGIHAKIRAAFREGLVTKEAMQVFTTLDKRRQITTFNSLVKEHGGLAEGNIMRAWWVRDRLDRKRVEINCDRAKYVGIEAYEKAGGKIDEDLFGNRGKGTAWIADVALLDRLVVAKIKRSTTYKRLKKAWKWVEPRLKRPGWEDTRELGDRATRTFAPTDEERLEMERLQADMQGLAWEERQPIQAEYRKIREAVERRAEFSEDTMARSGWFLYPDHRGKVARHGPFFLKGDRPKGDKKAPKKKLYGLTKPALAEIRRRRGGVVRANLTRDTAWVLVAYELATQAFKGSPHLVGALEVELRHRGGRDVRHMLPDGTERGYEDADPKLLDRMKRLNLEWLEADEPWQAFLSLTPRQQNELFTMAVATLMRPQLAGDEDALPQYETVAGALNIPWGAQRPTAETLFSKWPKAKLLEVGREYLGDEWAVRARKLKKADLAAAMEKAFAEDGEAGAEAFIMPGYAPEGGSDV